MSKQGALLPLVLSALLLLFYYFLLPWHDVLFMRYPAVSDGAWWQLVTAQLIHHDQSHLWFNVVGIWMCWVVFADHFKQPKDWLVTVPVLLASSIGQLIGAPANEVYAGFSGTLYGLFAYAALKATFGKDWIGLVVVSGLVIKIAVDFEQPESGDVIAVFAHIGGVLCGFLLAVGSRIAHKNR